MTKKEKIKLWIADYEDKENNNSDLSWEDLAFQSYNILKDIIEE